MKKLVFIIVLIIFFQNLYSQVRVSGYTRKNGTYVQPHMRSSPNGNPYDNYSFPGNTNPYTGKTSNGNPETYLENYYNRNNVIINYSNQTSKNSITNKNSNSLNLNKTEQIIRNYKLEEEKRKEKEVELIDDKINQFKKISKKQIPNEN
jgi:hypothetical protein